MGINQVERNQGITSHREEREREMVLLLILLMSTAFGKPSSEQLDIGADIANQLDILTKFSHEAGTLFVNSSLIEEVVKSLLVAEEDLLQMEVGLKTLTYQFPELRMAGNYFTAFNRAKSYVRQTRQGFREFAHKAKIELRDLKILIQDVNKNEDSFLLEISLGKMKDLMSKTLKTLKEAEENYTKAVETFEDLNSSITSKKEELDKMLTRDYAWRKTVTLVETEVCQNKSKDIHDRVNQFLKDAEHFFKPGTKDEDIRKVINTEQLCLDRVPDKVSAFEAELEKLQGITGGTLEKTKHFDENIMKAIDVLTGEIDRFDILTEKVKDISQTIDNYPEEYVGEFLTIKTAFITGIDDLKKASENFLAQPKDILYLNEHN